MLNEMKSRLSGKTAGFVKKFFLPMLLLAFLTFFVGCQDDMTVQSEDDITTDQQALEKLADEDSVLMSFEPSYNKFQIYRL